MKIRQGFVSNSSSSSFIIGHKGDLKEEILKAFEIKIPANYPIENFRTDIPEKVYSSVDDTYNTWDDYIKDHWYRDVPPTNDDIKNNSDLSFVKGLFDKGFIVSVGGFSDDSDSGISSLLCDSTIDVDTPTFVMQQEGGY
jgi:hypothetical protein